MPEEFFTPLQEYEKARKMAQKQYRASVSAGKYPYLPALTICCLMKILYQKAIWES